MSPLQYPIYHPNGPRKLTKWQGTLLILLHKMLIRCLVTASSLRQTPYTKTSLPSPKLEIQRNVPCLGNGRLDGLCQAQLLQVHCREHSCSPTCCLRKCDSYFSVQIVLEQWGLCASASMDTLLAPFPLYTQLLVSILLYHSHWRGNTTSF